MGPWFTGTTYLSESLYFIPQSQKYLVINFIENILVAKVLKWL